MKRSITIFLILLVTCLAWFGFNRAALPAVPEICGELSKDVPLSFKVNKVGVNDIELQIIDDIDFFVHFKMTGPWKTGQPGLVMKETNNKSKLSQGMSPKDYKARKAAEGKGKEDFAQFMSDKRGKDVTSYKFNNTIVEGKGGKWFMKMTYQGADIPMLQILKLEKAISIPIDISRKFESVQHVTFLPGTYRFDKKINGFYIGIAK